MLDRPNPFDVVAGNQAGWPVNVMESAGVLHLPGAEAVFTLFNLVFVVLNKRAIPDEGSFRSTLSPLSGSPQQPRMVVFRLASALPETPIITPIRALNVVILWICRIRFNFDVH